MQYKLESKIIKEKLVTGTAKDSMLQVYEEQQKIS